MTAYDIAALILMVPPAVLAIAQLREQWQRRRRQLDAELRIRLRIKWR
jgi:hypothetical protein